MEAPPVQYVRTSDGYDIAYTVSGAGRPLILLHPAFTSVQFLSHHYGDWIEGLTERFRLLAFDNRGEGLSTRGLPPDTKASDFIRDIEAVADIFGEQSFILQAFSSRGHDAVRFAVANPERVEAIIWSGAAVRESTRPRAYWQAFPRQNWEMFVSSLVPRQLDMQEQARRLAEYESCCTLEDWSTRRAARDSSDIEMELRSLQTPLLVLHPRSYRVLPIEVSAEVAALAPNSRFVAFGGYDAWGEPTEAMAAIDAFLTEVRATSQSGTSAAALSAVLSPREIEVLQLLAGGRSNQQIADELVISLNTVRRHVSNIFDKTGVGNRAEAALYARDHGLA